MKTKKFFARLLLGIVLLAATAVFTGPAQALSDTVVISQVYGGGGNSGATYTNDFIELFNRGSVPVSLDGWTLQYTSAAGSSWQTTELSGTLQPGQYFLVQQAQGSGGTTPLPTPDVVGTLAMSASNGKVALVSDPAALSGSCPGGPALVDLVGYGSAGCFEGSTPAPSLGSTAAALRGGGGCSETDENGTDFTAEAPMPRNSASPSAPCSLPSDPGGSGAASPNPVTPGSMTLLTVTVVPGTNPDSTGLTVLGNLNAIGLTDTQPFFDDGSNGDVVAGDNVFSFQVIVPASVSPGSKSLPVSLSDDQGRSGMVVIDLDVETAGIALLVINEVDYDQPGSDTAEFVEIKNAGLENVSLENFSLELVNGSSGGAVVYQSFALPSVTLIPGAFFVVCSDAANVPNCGLDVSPDTNLMQNGSPDAVGLRQGGVLVDAISYEGDSGAPYTEVSGTGLEDPDTAPGMSLSRCPDGTDTDQNSIDFSLHASTPGSQNACQENAAPTVSAGGPYSVDEGGSVVVSAEAGDPDGDPLSFAWDLDGDGVFETPGQSVPFSAEDLDGPVNQTIQVQASDPGGLSASAQAQVNIMNADPSITVNAAMQTVQYSDPLADISIEASDSSADFPLAISSRWSVDGGSFSDGLPAWLLLTSNGCAAEDCTWTLSGTALTAPGTYVVRQAISDKDAGASEVEITINVGPEDARATYSGALFAATSSTASSTAEVTLAATIQDISAASLSTDPYTGDIRNAVVTFIDRDSGGTALCSAAVGLIDPGDPGIGAAVCNWTVDLGNADSISIRVGIVVGGHYLHDDPGDDAVVTVSRPLASSFITGGGYIVLDDSAGWLSGDAGSRANFGFNVRYNKTGRSLKGQINIILRRTEADGLHVYQIKGNAMASLALQPGSGMATFNGKASIQDITDPLSPVSVDGNAILQVTIYDNGEPGSSDAIGITLWRKDGALWFSSSWDGVQTLEQVLDGGNLYVR